MPAERARLGDLPRLRGLFAYWNGKRGGRELPSWKDLDPVEMRQWLGRVHLVEVDNRQQGRDFRYRIYATEIAHRTGKDYTGQPVRAQSPSDQARYVPAFAEAAEHRAALFSDHSQDDAIEAFRHIRIILPLSDDGTTVDRLLVGLEPMAFRPMDAAPRPAAVG